MKISGFDPIKSTGGAKRTGSVARSGTFSDLLALAEAADTAQAAPVSDATAVNALNNLLALQEISEEDIQRKKLVQRGKHMLDVLERLRQQLLTGSLSPALIQDLARQLSIQKQLVSDPGLLAVIDDIELRAAVELAKLEVALKARDDRYQASDFPE
jgi:hypothetical protein